MITCGSSRRFPVLVEIRQWQKSNCDKNRNNSNMRDCAGVAATGGTRRAHHFKYGKDLLLLADSNYITRTVQDHVARLACFGDGTLHAVHTGELGLVHPLCHHYLLQVCPELVRHRFMLDGLLALVQLLHIWCRAMCGSVGTHGQQFHGSPYQCTWRSASLVQSSSTLVIFS